MPLGYKTNNDKFSMLHLYPQRITMSNLETRNVSKSDYGQIALG